MPSQTTCQERDYQVKTILVGDCSHYSYITNNCTKCGRSMPDLCLEFEEMKRKAAAYDKGLANDKHNTDSDTPSDTDIPNKRVAGLPISSEPVDPYVTKAAKRGRPPKAKL